MQQVTERGLSWKFRNLDFLDIKWFLCSWPTHPCDDITVLSVISHIPHKITPTDQTSQAERTAMGSGDSKAIYNRGFV